MKMADFVAGLSNGQLDALVQELTSPLLADRIPTYEELLALLKEQQNILAFTAKTDALEQRAREQNLLLGYHTFTDNSDTWQDTAIQALAIYLYYRGVREAENVRLYYELHRLSQPTSVDNEFVEDGCLIEHGGFPS